jgi:hypothetical protein
VPAHVPVTRCHAAPTIHTPVLLGVERSQRQALHIHDTATADSAVTGNIARSRRPSPSPVQSRAQTLYALCAIAIRMKLISSS